MTFREAIMFLLHNHEGPFPPEVWEKIRFMYKDSEVICPCVACGMDVSLRDRRER